MKEYMDDKKVSVLLTSILLFALLVLTASANSDYPNVGGRDFVFNNSKGVFRSSLVTSTTGSDTLTAPKGLPLEDDLDGDGVSEIVIIDGSSIKIYSGGTFTTATNSISTDKLSSEYKDMILYDVDGDGMIEVLLSNGVSGSLNVTIFEYNGSNFFQQADINITIDYSNGMHEIACDSVNSCGITWARVDSNSINNVKFASFSSSIRTNNITILTDAQPGGIDSLYCLSNIPLMTSKDWDSDGHNEYIFDWGNGKLAPSSVLIYSVDINSLSIDFSASSTYSHLATQGNSYCNSEATYGSVPLNFQTLRFTSPLVAEITGGGSQEIIVGKMMSSNTFSMESFNSAGVSIRTYPGIFTADGILVSNPILTNVFNSGLKSDFCVMGYVVSSDTLDLLCGTEASVFSFLGFPTIHSDEFVTTGLVDNSLKSVNARNTGFNDVRTDMIYSSEQGFSSGVEDIVTSYGVFSADFSGINFLGLSSNSSLNLNFVAPFQNGSVIMLDNENIGKSDMVIMDDNNLWYINDNFVNSAGQITSISTNPCINDVWKENATVQVRVKVEDVDGDKVASRVIFYNNDSDITQIQDSGWTNNFSSGTTFTFSFKANKTVSTGYIDVFGRDVVNPLSEDMEELLFTVASEGLVFGDSECTPFSENLTVVTGGTTTTIPGSVNVGNNTFKNAFDEPFIQSFGLGYTVMWLILMVIVGGAVWIYGSHIAPAISLGLVIFLEFLLFIIGVYLGFISVALVVILVVIAMIGVGIWLSRIFSKSGG